MPLSLKLTVIHAGETLLEETFEREIVKIGRLASAHLKLEDPKVSRIHAVIEASSDGTGYSVIDMGSAEGTFVNGEKVSKHRLREGDEILVGETRVVVALGDGPQPVAAPAAPAAAPGLALPEDRGRVDDHGSENDREDWGAADHGNSVVIVGGSVSLASGRRDR